MLPNIYKIENNSPQITNIINDINKRYKGVKAAINDDNIVYITIEQFCYSTDYELLFLRCINALIEVGDYFRKQINKIQ